MSHSTQLCRYTHREKRGAFHSVEHGQAFRAAAYRLANISQPPDWHTRPAPRTITLVSAVAGEVVANRDALADALADVGADLGMRARPYSATAGRVWADLALSLWAASWHHSNASIALGALTYSGGCHHHIAAARQQQAGSTWPGLQPPFRSLRMPWTCLTSCTLPQYVLLPGIRGRPVAGTTFASFVAQMSRTGVLVSRHGPFLANTLFLPPGGPCAHCSTLQHSTALPCT